MSVRQGKGVALPLTGGGKEKTMGGIGDVSLSPPIPGLLQ